MKRQGKHGSGEFVAGSWEEGLGDSGARLRVRTDFFTRPPRVDAVELRRMWSEQEGRDPPFTDARILAEMKKTGREKDYSHGVFDVEPGWRQTSAGIARVDVVRDSPSGSRNES